MTQSTKLFVVGAMLFLLFSTMRGTLQGYVKVLFGK